MKWKTKTERFLLVLLLSSFALSLFSFTTPPAQAATNLAPLSTWSGSENWAPCYWDTSVTHNGNPSWRNVGADPYKTREMNSKWIAVKPGDHIILQAWMKARPSDIGTTSAICPQSGARIGFDFYGGGRIDPGVCYNPQGGLPVWPNPKSGVVANFVPWGSDWQYREIDCIVPQKWGSSQRTPTGVVLWFAAMTNKMYGDYRWQNEDAPAWLSETAFYINPAPTPAPTPIPDNPLAQVFDDGFESGSLSAWTTSYKSAGSTAAVQSSIKHNGTYALDSSIPATAGAYAVVVKNFASSYSTLFARAYVQFSVLPTSGNRLLLSPTICDVNNNDLVAVYIYNDAGTYKWAMRYKTNSDIGWVYSSTPTPTINSWYCLEIKFVGASGTGEARLWVDGVERASKTGLTNNNALARQLQVGVYSSSALATHVYTDSVVTDNAYIGAETDIPTYSNVAHDSTVAAQSTKFSSYWQDDAKLSKWIFSWNGTGSWTNNTAVAFSGNPAWANASKTMPSSGTKVGYRWYANDTSNNWATTIIYSFTTTAVGESIVVLLNVPADDEVITTGTQSFAYTPVFSQAIQNASLWLNLTGTWRPVQWNANPVANNTMNSFSLSLTEPSVYIWNIAVYNSTTHVFAQANRTLTTVLNAHTPVLNDGFESGSLSAWTTSYTSAGSTVTVQSSTKYDGTYALDSSIPATAGAYAVAVKTFASSYSTLFARAYVQFSVLPTSGNRLLLSPTICDVNNNDLVAVYIYNDAGTYKWAMRYKTNSGIGWVYSSTPTPTINSWYCLEIKFVGASGTGEARLWVNGVERCAITGLTNNNALAQQVQVGAYSSSASAVRVFTDSVVVDSIYIGMGDVTRARAVMTKLQLAESSAISNNS